MRQWGGGWKLSSKAFLNLKGVHIEGNLTRRKRYQNSPVAIGPFSGCSLKTPFSSNQSALHVRSVYESHGFGGEWRGPARHRQIDRNVIHTQQYLNK